MQTLNGFVATLPQSEQQAVAELAQALTAKQLAWNAHKAAQRKQRKTERTLVYLGVPKHLRGRVYRIVTTSPGRAKAKRPPWAAPRPTRSFARTPRGRQTALRGV